MRDELFAKPQKNIGEFSFGAPVAEVFDDMIRRSLPGYDCVISVLGTMAARFARPASTVYDLGSSLGSGALSMAAATRQITGLRIVGVDKSEAMVARALQRIKHTPNRERIAFVCEDVRDTQVEGASLVVLNFTLQFLPIAEREELLARIFAGLLPGGALVLSEKLSFPDSQEGALHQELHDEFRRGNGYSQLELDQKREALQSVLLSEAEGLHLERLRRVGFEHAYTWFRCLNFGSMLAIKGL